MSCWCFGTPVLETLATSYSGDYHWSLDLSNMQHVSSHVLNRSLTLIYTENNFAFTKIRFLYLAVVLSSQLSQVFEEKNALSLQLRGSSRNICESHQHYSEVLNRCLVLERQLQELQSADKGLVRMVILVPGREKLIADGSTNWAVLYLPYIHAFFQEMFATDAAPGAPQEKNEPQRGSYTPELQELQLR